MGHDQRLFARNGASTGTLQAYPAASPSTAVAQFGGTAGTVTLSGTLNAAGITFSQSGYLLTGGTLNLAPSTGPFVYTTNGGTNTIASTITSAGGTSVTKTVRARCRSAPTAEAGPEARPTFTPLPAER